MATKFSQIEWNKAHRALGLATYRRYHWKKTYGITDVDYHVTLELQGGKCAICKTDLPDITGRQEFFSIDHDHGTGKFRGLLCVLCNTGIGAFKDNSLLLKEAQVYLGH